MTHPTVKQAGPHDLEAVAELFEAYRQFYGQPADPQAAKAFLLARMTQAESVIFLAEDGERALGFTQLFPAFSSVSMRRTFILNDLYVRSEARLQGVGRLLLQAAETYARSAGALRLTLSTAKSNEQAQALYRAAGWHKDEHFNVFHQRLE